MGYTVGGEAAPKRRRNPKMKAAHIEKRQIDWLWKNWIPRGALTLLTGDPQAGKSTIICEIAAKLSTGASLPDDPGPRPPTNSWIMSSEDDASTTIVWRLENQEADLNRIFITDRKGMLDKQGLAELKEDIIADSIGLVVIDTLTTWMGGEIDINKANESMNFMEPLQAIAQNTGAAIVLVRHRRKAQAGDNKLYSGMGSIGFTAAVRSELQAVHLKDGSRFIEKTKGNVGAPPLAQAYSIEPNPDPTNPHGILMWRGPYVEAINLKKSAAPSKKPLKLENAKVFLTAALVNGPVGSVELVHRAGELGISPSTLDRAKKEVGVTSKQVAKNEYVWMLNG